MRRGRRKIAIFTPKMKSQFKDILLLAIGETIKAKFARLAGAATIAAASKLSSSEDVPPKPPEAPAHASELPAVTTSK